MLVSWKYVNILEVS